MKKFTFLLMLPIIFMCGCSYGAIVSLPEQIAIFQNMGFECAPLDENLPFSDQINLNYPEQINQNLQQNGITCTLEQTQVLYLPAEEQSGADPPAKLAAIIFIYYLASPADATKFCKHYNKTTTGLLKAYNNVAIGTVNGEVIDSPSTNISYYNKFISGLKK